MLKKITVFILCVMLLAGTAFAAPSSWAKAEVTSAEKRGLVPEFLMTDYQNPITREQFCSMAILLYEKLSGKAAPLGDKTFTDTQNPDVSSAFSLGIVKGVSDSAFAPEALITREEIAAMFSRCVSSALPSQNLSAPLVNTFPDESEISAWALDSVKFANMCQVILGDENKNINPKANTTREQAILMTLRLYNCFKVSDTSVLESYGLATSGNYPSNMPGGSFAIKALSGEFYLADDSGIYESSSKNVITKRKSAGMYVASEHIYFIDAAENALYSVNIKSKAEELLFKGAVSFFPAGEYIYIKNEENTLFALSFKTKEALTISENITSMPLPLANTIYFATAEGIRSYDMSNGEYADIYKGIANEATLKDSTIYFKNNEGFLCSITQKGENFKIISPCPVEKYCIYSDAAAYTLSDGIYKCSLSGSFNIKITNDTNFSLNSYEKTLYIKSADGKIFKLNPFTAEKTPLN